MKTVFTNHELPHIWAKQSQPEGRSNSMKFIGPNYYSYQTIIGQFLPTGQVVLATNHYSLTTTKHQSALRAAVRHLDVITLPYLAQGYYPLSPQEIIATVQRQVENLHEKAAVARKKRDDYLAQAHYKLTELNRYLTAIGHQTVPVDDNPDLAALAITLKEEAAILKQERLAADKERQEKLAESLASWRSGNESRFSLRDIPCALRVKDDAVETSHGARVPLEQAQTLFRLYQACTTDTQRRRLHGHNINGYVVNEVTDKRITIGCHKIPMSEVYALSSVLDETLQSLAL